ncbi:MAG TPA: glycerol-3-phosphate 1-O-acyltransferase PlsY [Candidatus Syntrophosphaera sp.]|nr:glycerol-3-phosphate 1-O-acyltransferase PlsY [Candidatus Syntrophosphaera sp.]
MTSIVAWTLICLLAYLIGSIPFGWLAGKLLHKKDIRAGGSGNIGATNALRQYGVKTGVLVLLLDLLKGFAVAWLLLNVVPGLLGNFVPTLPTERNVFLLPALAVILGHMFPVWLNFKGGKGVATAAGVYLALAPVPLLAALLVFLLVTALSRYVSLGSILAAAFLFAAELLWNIFVLREPEFPWLTLIVALLVIYKHSPNILRLLEGRENRLSFGNRSKA